MEGLETALHAWRLIATASQQLLAEGRLRAVASLASALDAVGTTLADLLSDGETVWMQPALDSADLASQSQMQSMTSSPPLHSQQPLVAHGGGYLALRLTRFHCEQLM